MNIALTYNVRRVKPDINNPQYIKEAEFDEPSTINGISQAIEGLGHKVYGIEADEEAYKKLSKLKHKINLVFNIAEGLHGADREAQIPAMLEMLQIPYTGPRPLSYALGLDKDKAKQIMSYNGITTPGWQVIKSKEDLTPGLSIDFPVIVKPVGEGSSKGIRASSYVKSFVQLEEVVLAVLNDLKQPVMIEEFLPGREFTVAVIGTPLRVLPIIEVTFDDLPDDLPKFDHYEAKWVYDNPDKKVDPLICPAQISAGLEGKIKNICSRAFAVLEMADWARFDIRLDKNDEPNIIEVNCPPGIIPDPKENSRFPRAARTAGLEFPQMIEQILMSACSRYGLRYEKNN